jgi:hypothetical protein
MSIILIEKEIGPASQSIGHHMPIDYLYRLSYYGSCLVMGVLSMRVTLYVLLNEW